MAELFLALLGAMIATSGARDQTVLARLVQAQGARASALVIAVGISLATAAAAAWAGSAIAAIVPPGPRLILAWLALFMAGIEMLAIAPGRTPQEPTQSLGALGIVLAAHQITGAARFLIFALAMTTAPLPAGVGGAAGSAIALAAAWIAPSLFDQPRIRMGRRIIGIALLIVAAVLLAALVQRL